jgi:hypothetical protein
MSSQLHLDGFYQTGPVPWQDWHAGVRMHGVHFHYARYYPNGEWLRCYRDDEFEFWAFTESVTPDLLADGKRDRAPRIADADPLFTAGMYSIDGGILTEKFAPDWTSGTTWEWRYRILDDRLVGEGPETAPVAWLFHPARHR